MESRTYYRDCGDFVYDEEYFDFLVKYDNNLAGVEQTLKPECMTLLNSQFLVAYRRAYEETGKPISQEELFRIGYDRIPKCFGLMDATALQEAGILPIQNLPGLSLFGRDVLIGFIDTGIDYANPLFRNADGTSRIAAIWDQTEEAYRMETIQALSDGTEAMRESPDDTGAITNATGVMRESPDGTDAARTQIFDGMRPQSVFGYGREYTQEMLNVALQSGNPYQVIGSRDENGHGTFLASVAAGSFFEQDGDFFSGAAPESEIIMVKLKPAKKRLRQFFLIPETADCYSEADIILGVRYLINKAMELGKPLVICLGIGSNQGDHNGNLNLELYLDTIVSLPGICVVSAGGNELGNGGHFASLSTINPGNQNGILQPGSRMVRNEMEVYVEENNPGFCMEIWGRAPSIYEVAVVSPTGERFDRLVANRDSSGMITYLYEATTLYAESVVVENNSGDPFVLLRFEKMSAGIWRIEVTESYNSYPAGYDAWLPIRQFLQGGIRFSRPDPEVILCAPANARGSISVAGYNHRDNSLYIASSRGYTRKGRIQPDFAAPAVNVSGAFAGGSGSLPLFVEKSGTSVAAAITAGACALLLEWGIVRGNNYGMNTEVIRQMLIRGARMVVELPYPNPSWGWGVLDVYGALQMLRQ